MTAIGLDADCARTKHDLLAYGTARAARDSRRADCRRRRAHKASMLSFVLDGVHPHDIGTIVDQRGRGRCAPAITARSR